MAKRRVTLTLMNTLEEPNEREAELIRQIKQALSNEGVWNTYHQLIARRDAEILAPGEHAELIRLTDVIEIGNAERLRNLIQLAQLRGTSLEAVKQELGIRPR